VVAHARLLSWITSEDTWTTRCNYWRIIFVTHSLESWSSYRKKIWKSKLVPRQHSILSSEWGDTRRIMCTINQDRRTIGLARTAGQLQERSSGYSRCIQCSNRCGEYLGVKFPQS
jgi:hypothetical protein